MIQINPNLWVNPDAIVMIEYEPIDATVYVSLTTGARLPLKGASLQTLNSLKLTLADRDAKKLGTKNA